MNTFLDPDGGATIQVVASKVARNFDKGLWLIQSQTVERWLFPAAKIWSTHARRIIVMAHLFVRR